MKHIPKSILGEGTHGLLCACLVAIVASSCGGSETANAQAKPKEAAPKATSAPAALDKARIQGNINLQTICPDDGKWNEPKGNAQEITIIVAHNDKSKHDWKYATSVLPTCAGISRKGPLSFVLNIDLVDKKEWEDEHNTIDIEFSFPVDHNPPHKGVNGPFDRVGDKPEFRGVYEDVFKSGPTMEIPAVAVSDEIKKGWTGGYTVRIWNAKKDLIGIVDPGVKVIDDPEGLIKK